MQKCICSTFKKNKLDRKRARAMKPGWYWMKTFALLWCCKFVWQMAKRPLLADGYRSFSALFFSHLLIDIQIKCRKVSEKGLVWSEASLCKANFFPVWLTRLQTFWPKHRCPRHITVSWAVSLHPKGHWGSPLTSCYTIQVFQKASLSKL